MANFVVAMIASVLLSCAHDPSEVVITGELVLNSRYIEQCGSRRLYALVFPSSVAVDFLKRVEALPKERSSIASLRGFIVSAPPSSNVAGTLAVLRVGELALGTCPDTPD